MVTLAGLFARLFRGQKRQNAGLQGADAELGVPVSEERVAEH
jgi:hypothetical protein